MLGFPLYRWKTWDSREWWHLPMVTADTEQCFKTQTQVFWLYIQSSFHHSQRNKNEGVILEKWGKINTVVFIESLKRSLPAWTHLESRCMLSCAMSEGKWNHKSFYIIWLCPSPGQSLWLPMQQVVAESATELFANVMY